MSKRIFTSQSRLLIAAAALLAGGMAHAQVAVIIHPGNTIGRLTAAQVTDIYLGRSKTLPGGVPAQPADLPESSALRDQFYTRVTGRNAAQVRTAWSRLVFSGRGMPPRELPSAAAVKRFVATHPNAIGYIEISAVDDTVRVALDVD